MRPTQDDFDTAFATVLKECGKPDGFGDFEFDDQYMARSVSQPNILRVTMMWRQKHVALRMHSSAARLLIEAEFGIDFHEYIPRPPVFLELFKERRQEAIDDAETLAGTMATVEAT